MKGITIDPNKVPEKDLVVHNHDYEFPLTEKIIPGLQRQNNIKERCEDA